MNPFSSIAFDEQQAATIANYYLSSSESLALNEEEYHLQSSMGCYPPSASSSVTSFEDELHLSHQTQLDAPTQNWSDFKFDSQGSWSQQYLAPPSEEPTYSQVPLYAPIPRSHDIFDPLQSPADYSFPATQQYDTIQQNQIITHAAADTSSSNPGPIRTVPKSRRASRDSGRPYPQQSSLLHPYVPESGAQTTFQTPSELLQDLNSRDALSTQPNQETRHATQRKSLRRALAASVGFEPTDPDTISAHDKKRQYLECLENYILYIHDQLQLVGHEHVKLERLSTYRGLSSRSIRTLLVHMENSVRKLHQETLSQEQVYMDLRDQVAPPDAQEEQDAATAADKYPGRQSFDAFAPSEIVHAEQLEYASATPYFF
ncbi:hypothetical protein FIBSPDRAFT_925975 [Athelia psychrophila]|uniref:Uncharacterized protein n=1 Tax=Athelia psychrophila TaxID=1759441 RepID=A0A166U3Z9_9AGAM|nr:hypothetical protein FIBSPDRAFT_925975 [Fibularhizoctonia sp. CBS 109695]